NVSADTLRPQARSAHSKVYGALHNEGERLAAKAGETLLQIHHRIPLEYRHLFESDPNRLSNLIGLHKNVHAEVSGLWTAFRNAHENPTRAEVLEFALTIDRGYSSYYNTLRTSSSFPSFR